MRSFETIRRDRGRHTKSADPSDDDDTPAELAEALLDACAGLCREIRQLRLVQLDIFNQIPRLAQYSSDLLAFFNASPRITSMLERILVSFRSARSGGTAMHATALPSKNCRRPTGAARSSLCSTPGARAHWARVSRMITHHLCFCSADLHDALPCHLQRHSSEELRFQSRVSAFLRPLLPDGD